MTSLTPGCGSNSEARKRTAETADEHAGCVPGTCRAGDQWRTVSCAGAPVLSIPLVSGEVMELDPRPDRMWVIPGPGPIAAELERFHLIGQSMRDEISDEDWEWFCGHRLSAAVRVQWGEIIPVLLEWIRQRGGEGDASTGSILRGLHADLDDPREHSGAEEGNAPVEADGVHQPHVCEGRQESDGQCAESGEHERPGGDLHAGKGTDIGLPSVGECLTAAEREQVRAAWSEWVLEEEFPRPRQLDRIYPGVESILSARSQRPEGVTVTEWGVRLAGGSVTSTGYMEGVSEGFARAACRPDDRRVPPSPESMPVAVMSRRRSKFPDAVTEWAAVSGDTEAGGES